MRLFLTPNDNNTPSHDKRLYRVGVGQDCFLLVAAASVEDARIEALRQLIHVWDETGKWLDIVSVKEDRNEQG